MISEILNFSNNAFETAKFWCIVSFTFITKEKLQFSLIWIFYWCLVKEGWSQKIAEQLAIQGAVTNKPLVYKKN